MTEQFVDRLVPPVDPALSWVAQCLHDIDDAGTTGSVEAALARAVHVVLGAVSGAQAVSVVLQHSPGRFHTAAATDQRATAADRIQLELGRGPSLSAITDARPDNHHADLTRNLSYLEYGRLLAAATGFTSLLTFRLSMEQSQRDRLGCLNVYAGGTLGFTTDAVLLGEVLADRTASVVSAMRAQETIEGLAHARDSNRTIGVAIGVIMSRYRVTRDQAFDMLRTTSQNTNRKVLDLAVDVVDTGELELVLTTEQRSRSATRPRG